MSLPHFFIDDTSIGILPSSPHDLRAIDLPRQVIDHMHTLRLKPGEHIVLVDAPWHGWEIELTATPDKKSQRIEGVVRGERSGGPAVDVTLVQGISTGDRMDQTIRQVTELGVSRIIPLESERSTVRLTAASRQAKHERWRRIARGAAEQSGRLTEPGIDSPKDLASTLETLKDHDVILFFWEEAGGITIKEALSRTRRKNGLPDNPEVALFIGPEGGFSKREADLIEAAGAKTVTLGETILRTETAAVVATALVLHRLGALGGR
jgi:16S rRNA (uracil1498-N3)-methyltransferase